MTSQLKHALFFSRVFPIIGSNRISDLLECDTHSKHTTSGWSLVSQFNRKLPNNYVAYDEKFSCLLRSLHLDFAEEF